MESSCKGCTRRTVGCHSTCEEYKEFRTRLEKMRKNERDECVLNGYVANMTQRIRKQNKEGEYK